MASSHHRASITSRLCREVSWCVLIIFCVAMYSILGSQISQVIVHEHHEPHTEHLVELSHAADSHQHDHENHNDDDDHHDGEEGEHHHHFSYSGSTAMASVWPSSHSFFQRVTKLRPSSLDEACPSGPVFEMIKPPQVS